MSLRFSNILLAKLGIILISIILMAACNPTSDSDVKVNSKSIGKSFKVLEDAGWCWFQDPRAIIHDSKLIVGGVSGTNGDIKVGIYDLKEKKSLGEVILYREFEADDHDSPVFYVKEDGSVIAIWAKHGREPHHYFSISDPSDILKWSDYQEINYEFAESSEGNWGGVCYSNLYTSRQGELYNFFRFGMDYHPYFTFWESAGSSWTVPKKLIEEDLEGKHRPYVRYAQKNDNTVAFSFTDAHPRQYGNSIYYSEFDGNNFIDSKGIKIKSIQEGPLYPSESEKLFIGSETFEKEEGLESVPVSAWTSDLAIDSKNHPHIAYTLYLNNEDHRYRIASYDGKKWIDREIAYAGTCLYEKESSYTGLISLDPQNPELTVISSSVNPKTGEEISGQFEIYMSNIKSSDKLESIEWTAITSDSKDKNIRPLIVSGDGFKVLLWLSGPWNTYESYESDIVGIIL